MWPWEHAIIGYLSYSLICHLVFRTAPGGPDAFAVVFASVLPDLIDKPLAWEFGVFEAGYAIGHSLFFAVPLSILVGTIARRVGRARIALAFPIGYLLHLPSDILYSYASERVLYVEIVLWPIAVVPGDSAGRGFLGAFELLFGRYVRTLLAGDVSTYVWIQFGLAGIAFLVWLYDGLPVLRDLYLGCRRIAHSLIGSDRSTRE
ncbi:hydrolase [Natrinema saccharevitans]|uniref:Hydrolase n=1 Tax=Natrinema saccharevitans TaxID=301967 RepID=A0A1S8AWW7_9EURY|nr:metal-dependent hydrolase [Natrinema saccharevitans]OLZ41039.1 hydrolase [Natrinema saccharevitans]